MKYKSFFSSLLLLALLSTPSAAQSFSATDTTGKFTLIYKSRAACPKSIVHNEVLSTDQDSYYRIPHEEISQEGVTCSPGGSFLIMNDDHYESTIRIQLAVRQASGEDILSALYGMQSPVLIGVERDARVCGSTGFPKETSFLFFRYDGVTTLQDLPAVEEGTVIMVSFETNPDKPCIYATKTAHAIETEPLAEEDIVPVEDDAPIDSAEVDFEDDEETATAPDTAPSAVPSASDVTAGTSAESATFSTDDLPEEEPEEKPSPVSAAAPPPTAVGPEPEEPAVGGEKPSRVPFAAPPGAELDPTPSTIASLPETDDDEYSQAEISPVSPPGKRGGREPVPVTGPTVLPEPTNIVSVPEGSAASTDNAIQPVAAGDTGGETSVNPASSPTSEIGGGGFLELPQESSEAGDGGSDSLKSGQCFPGDAKALLPDGSRVRLDELQVGTRVAVGEGEFSQVIAFTHADRSSAPRTFIQLATVCGKSIRATAGHLLHINERQDLVAMKSVRIGDAIALSTGNFVEVVKIDATIGFGLFNPQTASGNILVDDVIMSTYTEAIHHITAHSLLAPIRMAWKIRNTLKTQTMSHQLRYAAYIPITLRLYGISFSSGT